MAGAYDKIFALIQERILATKAQMQAENKSD
jgi:hypothetical protein